MQAIRVSCTQGNRDYPFRDRVEIADDTQIAQVLSCGYSVNEMLHGSIAEYESPTAVVLEFEGGRTVRYEKLDS